MAKSKFRWLKWLGIIFGGLFTILLVLYFIFSEPRPEGVAGEAAEALATKVQTAINCEAWDTTEAVQWTFKGMHTFLWDKKRHWVKVNWADNEALIRIDSVDGRVWEKGVEITADKKRQKILKKALHYWMNDSFWLNAPAKLFDKGTERSVVQHEGKDALMVTYTTGGATPGDSYLWILDENNLPTSWKMWVTIIPIGGVEFTWENWITTETGAKLATLHNGLLELPITDIKTGALKNFGATDPFAAITGLD